MRNISTIISKIYLLNIIYYSILLSGEREILVVDNESMGILKAANNNYTQSDLLHKVNKIINDHPQSALAHQVKGKLLFYSSADIESAVEELNIAQDLLNSIPYQGDSLEQELKISYQNISGEIQMLNDNINSNFINLRFKIKGVKIDRLCRIEGANINFQYNPKVFEMANTDQKRRFITLKKLLENASFYLSELDTESQELFFEISYFPYIMEPIKGEPFSITINNEYRYHFMTPITPIENSPPIEIEWSPKYQLIESLPKNKVKLIHAEDLPITISTVGAKKPFSLVEEKGYLSTYIPVKENSNLDIVLEENYPGQRLEKVLFKISKISGLFIIVAIFIIIR